MAEQGAWQWVLLLALGLALPQEDERMAERARMVERQIEAFGVRDPAVLEAMRTVPRHRFVPDALQSRAYVDRALPIPEGQTISQPYVVALMTELAEVRPGHRTLEIGTGSGYQAAVLAQLGAEVFTVERIGALSATARQVLGELGYDRVRFRVGDGYSGWPAEAPFDRIVVTAAPPEIPEALLDQLAPGGRLVAPAGPEGAAQTLLVAERDASGEVRIHDHGRVYFVPMVPGVRPVADRCRHIGTDLALTDRGGVPTGPSCG